MMAPISFASLADKYGGVLIEPDARLSSLSTDSRSIKPGQVFVALKGDNFDGHQYLQSAVDLGAAALVTEKVLPQKALNRAPQWIVKNSLRALGYIAIENRQRFAGKLVALTGSNGKTSVKEMIASILGQSASIHATKGNLNNHIGVPLTLLGLGSEHEYAVIEMGASSLGEINYLTGLASPDVALVNNVGDAHVGEFGGVKNIEIGKGEIFNGLASGGTGVVNLDSLGAERYLEKLIDRKVITFSLESPSADIRASAISLADSSSTFYLETDQGSVEIGLAVGGRHMVANALAAASCCKALGIPLAQIAAGLRAFSGVAGRVQQIDLANGARLIDDSYNASPSSVRAAIDLLANYSGAKILVLGDMAELGEESARLHWETGAYAASRGIDHLLAVGEQAENLKAGFEDTSESEIPNKGAETFVKRSELALHLQTILSTDSCVLVKGSRSSRMEDVVNAIQDREA